MTITIDVGRLKFIVNDFCVHVVTPTRSFTLSFDQFFEVAEKALKEKRK